MMNSKASFLEGTLIKVIISLVFLIIMFFFISSVFDDSELGNASKMCSTLFSKVSSSSLYYQGNSNFKDSFWSLASSSCSSFSTTIKEEESLKSAEYIDRCWAMTGGDTDFLPSAYEGGVCMYCGDISLDTEYEYDSFRSDLKDSLKLSQFNALFETYEVTSLNSLLLDESSFPVNLNSNRSFGVIVYNYKGEFSTLQDLSNSGMEFASSVASLVGGSGVVKDFFDKSSGTFKETQKGIGFVEYDEEDGPVVNNVPLNEAYNCRVIVPNTNINY